ncbi:MAG: pyruvate ferredoxin oxidoreductase [Desulfobacteraceae bacterium 4484_190.3]|nr:MAG: pyruvate ferredoxin oxidoreductase [Desulfobacteraceae bacterium 4484_190.3]
MKQQIIVSGIGGQGVLFLTRLFAQAAVEEGLDVLTSETHGMAMRGGTVVSHLKVGPFKSPLIRMGQCDVGLFINASNLDIYRNFIRPGGRSFVNTDISGEYYNIDATGLAKECGSLLVTNLVLLGYAVKEGNLFCDEGVMETIIRKSSQPDRIEMNLKGFKAGASRN